MKTYSVKTVRLRRELNPAETEARMEAARLWNRMVKILQWFLKRRLLWPGRFEMDKHFKRKFKLHSQTIQAIVKKFYSNLETTLTNKKNGDKKARFPHKMKKYLTVPWPVQAIKLKGNILILPMGKGREPLKFKLPYIPEGEIVWAELDYGVLYLTIKQTIPDVAPGENIVAADLGVIHTAVLTDGEATIGVVGRELRATYQKHNKKKSIISKKLARCKKGSRRWKKLKRSLRKSAIKRDNVQTNILHHAANKMVDFCKERQAKTLVVGDVTEINRNKKGKSSKRMNQENGNNPLGKLTRYLEYKLKRVGCEVQYINEAYTTRTCPVCGHRHKPVGRIYRCRECGSTFVRDEVGATNILNKFLHGEILPGKIIPTNNVKYLRPVKLGRSRPAELRLVDSNQHVTWRGEEVQRHHKDETAKRRPLILPNVHQEAPSFRAGVVH